MPRINLKDEDPTAPSSPNESSNDPLGGLPPAPDNFGDEPSRKTPWIIFGVLILVAAIAIVFLNQKNIIHLWGKKAPQVVEALPEPAAPVVNDSAAMSVTAPGSSAPATGTKPSSVPASKPTEAKAKPPAAKEPAPTSISEPAPGASEGEYAVQISSWAAKSRAAEIVNELNGKGFRAYVADGVVGGTTWYRVRVGNYATSVEANDAIAALSGKGFAGGIVVKAGK